jgi:hypothetical protein
MSAQNAQICTSLDAAAGKPDPYCSCTSIWSVRMPLLGCGQHLPDESDAPQVSPRHSSYWLARTAILLRPQMLPE